MTVLLLISFSAGAESEPNTAPGSCPLNLLNNPGFELPVETPNAAPLNWTTNQWSAFSTFSRDYDVSRSGSSSIRIVTSTMNDASFSQYVNVAPNTAYLLTGWIKTENVAQGAGASLCLAGSWTHTEGIFGTRDWTFVRLWFNSGSDTRINIGARLGYWSSLSTGTAWFDDLRLTPLRLDDPHPRWKILVLIYDKTDAVLTDVNGVRHHMVGAMTPAEISRATVQATQFVQSDIPALDSGNMIPELTIRYPDHPLTQLDRIADVSWWPSPANTAPERDPAFDSVIVIWDPRVVDQDTGTRYWIGGYAGLTPGMGTGQTYFAMIIEATGYGHRNVFKHEWGHSILFYFDAAGTAPKPTVTNHIGSTPYVHWPTGDPYVGIDETDANPIPNSIYNYESGFTHDYYSGTTATPDQPTRRLGITPEAWMLGGPVTKPGISSPPPVVTCNANIAATSDPGTCSARLTIAPPEAYDECGGDLKPAGSRNDGLPLDAPYSCGETVITWTATNAANVTSSCQQVVTVKDEEPPTFISTFPPVTITTEANATSCGVTIDEATLRVGPHDDPVVLDPAGDALPAPSLTADITAISSTVNSESITFKVDFAGPVYLASVSDSTHQGLFGYIELDTDQNPATGTPAGAGFIFPPAMNMGVDYLIDIGSERTHAGFVDVITRMKPPGLIIGQVPIMATEKSFSVTVPLALLGNDNGLVNYVANLGVLFSFKDRVPNGTEPATSVPSQDVIAIDNCSRLSVTRSGVPANNLFPIGETIITYIATDANGNSTSVSQTVSVIDNTPPVIANVATNPAVLWPPNHQMIDVTVSYDVVECAIAETWLSVDSDDPDAASDWEVVDAHHVRLRAKRSPRAGDRVYTITISVKDTQGNVASRKVTVRVPKHK
jgi:hypothetical protein